MPRTDYDALLPARLRVMQIVLASLVFAALIFLTGVLVIRVQGPAPEPPYPMPLLLYIGFGFVAVELGVLMVVSKQIVHAGRRRIAQGNASLPTPEDMAKQLPDSDAGRLFVLYHTRLIIL